jgi:hypothetical protein
MFPDAQFIQLIRDGREVVSSMVRSGFSQPWAESFEMACKTWVEYVTLGQRFAAAWPSRVMTVRHEAMSDRPEHTCRKILGFLGLEAAEGPARFLRARRINSSYGPESVSGPAQGSQACGRSWSEQERAIFSAQAQSTLVQLGYSDGWESNP